MILAPLNSLNGSFGQTVTPDLILKRRFLYTACQHS